MPAIQCPHDPAPEGYGFVDEILNYLTVTPEGHLRSSGGVEYRALYLGGSSGRMTLSAVRRITELVDAGATVTGWRPKRSPSEGDNPRDWDAAVNALWNGQRRRLLDLAATRPPAAFAPRWTASASVPTVHSRRSRTRTSMSFTAPWRVVRSTSSAPTRAAGNGHGNVPHILFRSELWDGVGSGPMERAGR